MGVLRKAKYRVETLLAWALAFIVVGLLAAGLYWVAISI